MMRQTALPGPAWGAGPGFAGPGGLTQVDMGRMPAGSHFCARSVQIRDMGDGKAPQVITQTSGDCGAAAPNAAAPGVSAPKALAPAAAPQPGGLVQTRFTPAPSTTRIGI